MTMMAYGQLKEVQLIYFAHAITQAEGCKFTLNNYKDILVHVEIQKSVP